MNPKIAFEKIGHLSANVAAGGKLDVSFAVDGLFRPNFFRFHTETATGSTIALTFRVDGTSAALALAATATAGSGLIFVGQDGIQRGMVDELRFDEGVVKMSIGNPTPGPVVLQIFFAIVKS